MRWVSLETPVFLFEKVGILRKTMNGAVFAIKWYGVCSIAFLKWGKNEFEDRENSRFLSSFLSGVFLFWSVFTL